MTIKVGIEFHPENGAAPHVVITTMAEGGRLWFAKRSLSEAEEMLPELAFMVGQQWGDKVEIIDPQGYVS